MSKIPLLNAVLRQGERIKELELLLAQANASLAETERRIFELENELARKESAIKVVEGMYHARFEKFKALLIKYNRLVEGR